MMTDYGTQVDTLTEQLAEANATIAELKSQLQAMRVARDTDVRRMQELIDGLREENAAMDRYIEFKGMRNE